MIMPNDTAKAKLDSRTAVTGPRGSKTNKMIQNVLIDKRPAKVICCQFARTSMHFGRCRSTNRQV